MGKILIVDDEVHIRDLIAKYAKFDGLELDEAENGIQAIDKVKNNDFDLVVMDIETYNRREKMLELREELLSVEEDRMHGNKGYPVDEVTAMMRSAIKGVADHGTSE